ncbi:MAG TPA: MBL fold metallo-hydrolase [Longimicrobium sp.]|jgi:glyoxylase-like metal-dependent hydrolase (beta-lactamase superfamily II)|uniref:MBL fold metallo-hydrolase n=1 Tax=Longimicrobium sp. TaxID=2029185 RepID=UPI002ED91993
MSPSRRDFLATSAAAALGAALGRTPRFLGAQTAQQVVFTPLRRNVGTFTMRGGTVGWLVNPRGVAVVDTQFPAEARALLAGLQQRSGNRGVDVLLNTHHHGDHTGGNGVFRGVARRVVAHGMADQHMRRAPQPATQAQAPAQQPPAQPAAQPSATQPPPPEPLYPTETFMHSWSAQVGDERIVARHYGRGHTSGDAVITFERANVVHLGDLGFHRRHPVVDRAAGASMRNWSRLLGEVVNGHSADTIYIFGHAGDGLPVTGGPAEVLGFRDYLSGVLAFVERQVAAGRTREEVLAMRAPLAGFETWGPFGQAGARDPLTVAYEEVTTGA